MPSLKEKYKKEIIPELKKELGLKNNFQCPGIKKIVVNVGVGNWVTKDTTRRKEVLEKVSEDLKIITGQKPQIRPAKKSISGFSLREGMPIGLRVTLRGERMYSFAERLIHVVFPRVRDFQGVKLSSIDSSGNLTVGFEEQLVFPEISADNTDFFFGLEVTIVTSARSKEEGVALLKKIGVPLKKEESKT
jgi:large subunit ribosomal protein L5